MTPAGGERPQRSCWMAATMRAWSATTALNASAVRDGDVADGDHEHDAPAAYGLGVPGQAVPEHERVAACGVQDAVADLDLCMSGSRRLGLYVRHRSVPAEDRQGVKQALRYGQWSWPPWRGQPYCRLAMRPPP